MCWLTLLLKVILWCKSAFALVHNYLNKALDFTKSMNKFYSHIKTTSIFRARIITHEFSVYTCYKFELINASTTKQCQRKQHTSTAISYVYIVLVIRKNMVVLRYASIGDFTFITWWYFRWIYQIFITGKVEIYFCQARSLNLRAIKVGICHYIISHYHFFSTSSQWEISSALRVA